MKVLDRELIESLKGLEIFIAPVSVSIVMDHKNYKLPEFNATIFMDRLKRVSP